MKTIAYHAYGDRKVLALEDAEEPGAPHKDEIRVRVHATSINPVDGKIRRGELKLIAGGHFPKRPGLDFSGVVEAVGADVEGLTVGDAVFGGVRSMSEGAFAERIVVRTATIARPPKTVDPVTAAGIPTVAIAALQSLRDIVKVKPGDSILINGCAGGVGLYALQFAKQAGALVTGTCSPRNLALAKAFGADEAIAYGQASEALRQDQKFRSILELSGRLPFQSAGHLLEDHGLYVDFSPSPAALIGNLITNPFRSHKHVFAMTAPKTADLEFIARQIDDGQLRVAPTKTLAFDQFAEAFELAEGGGVVGKVVVRLA